MRGCLLRYHNVIVACSFQIGVTHTENSRKNSISFLWTAPSEGTGPIRFRYQLWLSEDWITFLAEALLLSNDSMQASICIIIIHIHVQTTRNPGLLCILDRWWRLGVALAKKCVMLFLDHPGLPLLNHGWYSGQISHLPLFKNWVCKVVATWSIPSLLFFDMTTSRGILVISSLT